MNLTISPISFRAQKINSNSSITPKTNSLEQGEKKNIYTKTFFRSYVLAGLVVEENTYLKLRKKAQELSKQVFSGDEFFINMKGYKKNETWAKQMEALTYASSLAILNGKDFNFVLNNIEKGINIINSIRLGGNSYTYGKIRELCHSFQIMEDERGCEYLDRYIKKSKIKNSQTKKAGKPVKVYAAKPNEEYKEANVSKISKVQIAGITGPIVEIYQESIRKYTISNLYFAKKEFEKLSQIENPTTQDVMRSCAIIQWLIAQETPYYRGSDSVANVLTKAIMHAYNVHISPVKEGLSLDFEAFDTDLDDYIEKYPDFFEEKPYKLES